MATSDEHAEFCERVKARRKELGLTQADVAKLMGVTQPAYSSIELGTREPGLNQLYRVCKALKIPIADLLPVASSV